MIRIFESYINIQNFVAAYLAYPVDRALLNRLRTDQLRTKNCVSVMGVHDVVLINEDFLYAHILLSVEKT